MGLSLVAAGEILPGVSRDEMWLKRQAIQIASQLPEDQANAVAVLEYAKILVTEFMLRDFKRGDA